MLFDFYQQRTKEGEGQVGGWASNITYDWEMFGTACGLEVDYVGGESRGKLGSKPTVVEYGST